MWIFCIEGLGKLLNTIKSVQKIHNNNLDIEGILLTMYDSRLRLSNQVVEEVKKHFGEIVFNTIIQRNIKLGEAPGFGKDIITYDVTSKGTKNYLSLADEIIKKNINVWQKTEESFRKRTWCSIRYSSDDENNLKPLGNINSFEIDINKIELIQINQDQILILLS